MGKHTNFSILGGNLCLPLFGCKVPYQPGSVALIRGHHLEHLVTDFTGPRYFVVGTNHESTKQAVWRGQAAVGSIVSARWKVTHTRSEGGMYVEHGLDVGLTLQ